MKVGDAAADGFVAAPPAALGAALVYGSDPGLIKERARRLVAWRLGDADETLAVTMLDGAELAADPARLADEVAALPLLGGPRVVWVRGAQESHAEIVEAALAGPCAADLVVIEAGSLRRSSPLVRWFEGGGEARAAIACYPDEPRRLRALALETLAAAGLEIDADALALLEATLGGDRLVTRAELAKLVAYMGEARRVRRADVAAVVGDSALVTAEGAAVAAFGGDRSGLERALARAAAEGIAPVALVRAASAHALRLLRFGPARSQGGLEAAIKRERLHFRLADAVREQLGRWPDERLLAANERLLEAEMAAKSRDAPARALVERVLLALAGEAARAHSAPPSRRRMSSS